MENFIFGMLFMSFIMPIVNSIVNIINCCGDYICARISLKAAKEKEEAALSEEGSSFAIGFQAPDYENEYEDEGE